MEEGNATIMSVVSEESWLYNQIWEEVDEEKIERLYRITKFLVVWEDPRSTKNLFILFHNVHGVQKEKAANHLTLVLVLN